MKMLLVAGLVLFTQIGLSASINSQVHAEYVQKGLLNLTQDTFDKLIPEIFGETEQTPITEDLAKHYDVTEEELIEAARDLYHTGDLSDSGMRLYFATKEE